MGPCSCILSITVTAITAATSNEPLTEAAAAAASLQQRPANTLPSFLRPASSSSSSSSWSYEGNKYSATSSGRKGNGSSISNSSQQSRD
jgi:hypothetical protein